MAGFRKRDARRIARATRYRELTPLWQPTPDVAPIPSYNGRLAITSSTITAATSSQLGSGTCLLFDVTITGGISSGTTSVTAFSWQTTTVASGSKVFLSVFHGIWVISGILCA